MNKSTYKCKINNHKETIFGKDFFHFIFSDNNNNILFINARSKFIFEKICKVKGSDCEPWVILYGNMDYLKCPDDLFWDGKHKCD